MMIQRNISIDKLQGVATILKTIGHPIRLEILEILEIKKRLHVSEIQDSLKNTIEQSLLSHHLRKMKTNGILDSTKEGMYVHYFIRDRNILKIFDCMENCSF